MKNMKKYVVGMAMLMAAGSVFADNSHQSGSIALGFDTSASNMIQGKFMLNNSLALTAGLGYAADGGDGTGSYQGVQGGVRYYLSPSDTSLFAGGRIRYEKEDRSTTNANPAFPDSTIISLMGEFGVEHFLAKQFSVEGTVGFGFGVIDDNATNATTTTFGTSRAGIGFNLYF